MKIAIIGCGNMGTAFAKRLSGTHKVYLFDRHKEKVEQLAKEGYGESCNSAQDAIQKADFVVLAVKPQGFQGIVKDIKKIKDRQVLISLLTGTSLATLKKAFPNPYIVRMMPNIAVSCGKSAMGLACDEDTPTKVKEQINKICETLGTTYWIPESKFNAFTSLAGSGPGFVFAIAEAMVDAGIAMGFNARDSQNLVYQMLEGSVVLLKETQKHPGELKWQVTSPEGTTIAGLRKFESQGVKSGIIETFIAAYERAKQLS